MRFPVLLTLLLITTLALAQPSMVRYYSPADSFSGARQLHILSRTVIIKHFDVPYFRYPCTDDSIVEHYDHNGNLLQLDEKSYCPNVKGGVQNSGYRFTYDTANRLVRDSSFISANSDPAIITYEYFPAQRMMIEHCNTYGDIYTMYYWYNNKNEIIRQYRVVPNGDTLSATIVQGQKTIYISRSRNDEGIMQPWDSSFVIATKSKVTRYDDDFRETWYYNGGLLRYSSNCDYGTLMDSTHYIYNGSGKLIRTFSYGPGMFDNQPDQVSTETDYTCDAQGRLIEEVIYEQFDEERITTTRYTYNAQGLVKEKTRTVKQGNEKEMMAEKVVFVYEFW